MNSLNSEVSIFPRSISQAFSRKDSSWDKVILDYFKYKYRRIFTLIGNTGKVSDGEGKIMGESLNICFNSFRLRNST